jgi:CBS-domain-containing membrane protein
MARDVDEDLGTFDDADVAAQRDLLDRLSHSVGNEPIQSYMSEVVDIVSQEATLAEAAKVMVKQSVHHLPVVDSKQSLVGILSTMDVLKAFAKHAP